MIDSKKKSLIERTFKEIEAKKRDFESNPDNSAKYFQKLIDLINERTKLDLSNYRNKYLNRRLMHRLSQLNIESYKLYLIYLKSHPQEFIELKDTLTIHTTEWFRDSSPFEYFRNELIYKMIKNRSDELKPTIRIISAPCSSGQEPYSIAMIIKELIEKEDLNINVEIFACDIEPKILLKAKRGIYTEKEILKIPKKYRKKYFNLSKKNNYQINPEIRRMVRFFKQNLFTPFPTWLKMMDLVMCRNLLIYISRNRQKLVLKHLRYILRPSGYLMLGKTESLLIFNPKGYVNENAREHIYQYKPDK